MKQVNKFLFLVIIVLGILLIAVACKNLNLEFFTSSNDKENTEITTTPAADNEDTDDTDITEEENITATADTEVDATPTPPAVILPTSTIDLPIYTVNESGDLAAVTAVIPAESELTPRMIVDNVIEALEDQSITVTVKDVTTKDDAIIVNFDKENPPYNNLGSGFEAAVLNAIAQSLIDNLDAYNGVIYRVDDKEYASGVFEFEIDEVYFRR